VALDVAWLKITESTRLMNCLEWHNRIGHEAPAPDQVIDGKVYSGPISTRPPYVVEYGPTLMKVISGVGTKYETQYQLAFKNDGAQITKVIGTVETEHNLFATSAMKLW
jgi:hypothetical protein